MEGLYKVVALCDVSKKLVQKMGELYLVRTDDLIAALSSGQIGAAALDVTDPEPIHTDSPLLRMENVVINSHVASASITAVQNLRKSAANIVACAIGGKKLPNVVNYE